MRLLSGVILVFGLLFAGLTPPSAAYTQTSPPFTLFLPLTTYTDPALLLSGTLLFSQGDGEYIDATGAVKYIWHIYTLTLNGLQLHQLTSGQTEDFDAVWSPDGTMIAFTSTRTGRKEIYLMQVDGSHLRQLTNNNGGDRKPSWSPDGKQLAFMSYKDCAIHTIRRDGTHDQTITQTAFSHHGPFPNCVVTDTAWSPDGKHILYDVDDGEFANIYEVDPSGSNDHRLSDGDQFRVNDTQPVWSPDGQTIAFVVHNTTLAFMRADGTSRRVTSECSSPGCVNEIAWSPDGQYVVVTTFVPGVFVRDAAAARSSHLLIPTGITSDITHPQWSSH